MATLRQICEENYYALKADPRVRAILIEDSKNRNVKAYLYYSKSANEIEEGLAIQVIDHNYSPIIHAEVMPDGWEVIARNYVDHGAEEDA